MCPHVDAQVIEEEMTEERWEGDFYVQNTFCWMVCPECGDDFACTPR